MRKKSKGDTWDGIFADPEVGRVLHANGLIADANKSSIKELATITSLNPGSTSADAYFYNNKVITKFPELQYCTGLSDLYGAFYGCSNLTEVGNIPEGVTNMSQTFNGCSNLINAPTIPEGVTTLYQTFYNCSSLITAPPIIPESVTYMYATFYNCSSLIKAPAIPRRVNNIEYVFRNCRKLDGIFVLKCSLPSNRNYAFENVKVVAIYVPDREVMSYKLNMAHLASYFKPMSQLPE